MSALRTGYEVGPTLYMPVTHPRARAVLLGQDSGRGPGAVVLCLEDALGPARAEEGLRTLQAMLAERAEQGGDARRVFLRPRDLAMAQRIAEMPGVETTAGFVIPKLTLETVARWLALPEDRVRLVMPTLETPEFFEASRVAAVAEALGPARHRIAVLRVGGNDLLAALGLRRGRGATAYESPLGYVLQMLASVLMVRGFAVAAPVFDILDDFETLAREVAHDVDMGFVSKTAVHPGQLPIIARGFAVSGSDLAAARAIADAAAAPVFQTAGAMCEPATHAAWAERILIRAELYGLREDGAAGVLSA